MNALAAFIGGAVLAAVALVWLFLSRRAPSVQAAEDAAKVIELEERDATEAQSDQEAWAERVRNRSKGE